MARCKRAGAMDFDDLLFQLYYLLHKNPDDVLEKYLKRFKYLLVDEFQDTNYLQYAIIKKLCKYEGSGNRRLLPSVATTIMHTTAILK